MRALLVANPTAGVGEVGGSLPGGRSGSGPTGSRPPPSTRSLEDARLAACEAAEEVDAVGPWAATAPWGRARPGWPTPDRRGPPVDRASGRPWRWWPVGGDAARSLGLPAGDPLAAAGLLRRLRRRPADLATVAAGVRERRRGRLRLGGEPGRQPAPRLGREPPPLPRGRARPAGGGPHGRLRLVLDGRDWPSGAGWWRWPTAPATAAACGSPRASLADGLLDVVVIADIGKLEFLRTFPKVFSGRHVEHPAVAVHRAARVELDADRPLAVYADGEPAGTLPATFEVRPRPSPSWPPTPPPVPGPLTGLLSLSGSWENARSTPSGRAPASGRSGMRRARLVALALLVALVAALLPAAPAAAADPPAAPACDPVRTPPELAGQVPTAEQVIGFPLGERDVTVAESDAYLQAVAAASPRVVAGTAATSWQGRPLRYAIVGRPGNVTPAGLARIRLQTALLRDPRTPAKVAAHLARTTPAILWVAGNVHGGEESGTDAALRVLYELADRRDCAAGQILDNAIVVLLPTQNPDGREADTRRNAYGFDLNRDWFARTQPETDGKLQLLRRYPPVLFIDAHEMSRETSSSRPTPTPSTTRSPTSRSTGSTTCTARPWPTSSPARASRSSTATSTTCSTWATATPCPPPGSSPPA